MEAKSCENCGILMTKHFQNGWIDQSKSQPLNRINLEFKGSSLREEYETMLKDEQISSGLWKYEPKAVNLL